MEHTITVEQIRRLFELGEALPSEGVWLLRPEVMPHIKHWHRRDKRLAKKYRWAKGRRKQ